MGEPEFSSFEQFVPPKSLAERLKAQANGQAEVEAASFMAERFAPDLQTPAVNDAEPSAPREYLATTVRAVEPVIERSLRSSGLILVAFALIALVPIIAFAALYSRGALSVTSVAAALRDSDKQAPQEVQQASSVSSAAEPETILPKQDIELPSVALTVPGAISAEAGKESAFIIALDSSEMLPPRSIITIRGLPHGTSFSAGRPFGETEWSLRPDEIGALRVTLPSTASGQRSLSVDLVAADGSMIASAGTRLDVAPDPKAALISRPADTARIDELIAHATQRQFIYTHRWRVHDLVIWDNRCTMHRGSEFDDLRWKRDMQRATVSDVANSCEQEGIAVAAA